MIINYKKLLVMIMSFFLMNSDNALSGIPEDSLHNRSYLTGQWNGHRQRFEAKGISYNLDYTSDLFSNVSGGIKNNSVYLDNTDITLSFEMEKLTGWKGTDFNFRFLGNHGKSPANL